jgi:L-amino acid N-acyltransferase YncA
MNRKHNHQLYIRQGIYDDLFQEPNGHGLMTLRIDPMLAGDWPRVCEIYLEGIATRQATFETEAPSWEAWEASHSFFARLVVREAETVVGWAALSPISARQAYAGVAEVSVYVAQSRRGFGLGRQLLEALIAASEENGIWSLQAVMFPENASSVALHRRCGFREVGRRERIAKLDGVWRDTILLERRSRKIGIDGTGAV